MALVLGVNSYANDLEGDFYFENRIDANMWVSASILVKEQALVTATQLIDQMNFAGYASTGNQPLAWPRLGSFNDIGRGRQVSFSNNFDLTTSDSWTNPAGDETIEGLFAALPREYNLLKIATMEQALHLISSNVLATTTTSASDAPITNLQVGSISISYGEGGATQTTATVQGRELRTFLRPLLQGGGSNLWFRAN